MFVAYAAQYPAEAADIKRRAKGELPVGWEACLPRFTPEDKPAASRKLSESLLGLLADALPEFMSGSADLTPSNLTRWKSAVDFQPHSTGLGEYSGRYMCVLVFSFGISDVFTHPSLSSRSSFYDIGDMVYESTVSHSPPVNIFIKINVFTNLALLSTQQLWEP